ncbi:hypothetical protein ATCC90586_006329 [Pythium insidiosum]|nr:hypothetical protein ATCC90586_006329 [Pythium insidiosum]
MRAAFPLALFAAAVGAAQAATNDTKCLAVREHIDLPGNDLSDAKAATAGDCCKLCSETAYCVAYTWSRYNGGTCYMKDAVTVRGVYNTPLPDGSPLVVSGEVPKPADQRRCLPVQEHIDYPGNDIAHSGAAHAGACCKMCTDTPLCVAYTWSSYNGGTCFMKDAKPARPVHSAPLPDGSPMVISGEVQKPADQRRCPPVQENLDFPGNDLASAGAAHPAACCKLCTENPKCAAYTWSRYNDGTCYMKHTQTVRPVYNTPLPDGSPMVVSGIVRRA